MTITIEIDIVEPSDRDVDRVVEILREAAAQLDRIGVGHGRSYFRAGDTMMFRETENESAELKVAR